MFNSDPTSGLNRLLRTEDPHLAGTRVRELFHVGLLAIALREAGSDEERTVACEAIREAAAGLEWMMGRPNRTKKDPTP